MNAVGRGWPLAVAAAEKAVGLAESRRGGKVCQGHKLLQNGHAEDWEAKASDDLPQRGHSRTPLPEPGHSSSRPLPSPSLVQPCAGD